MTEIYDVSIVPCPEYELSTAKESLIAVLSSIGAWENIKCSDKIAVKVNLVTGKRPETACTTHPVLIRALYELLSDMGARVIVGDSPGGLYNSAWVGSVYTQTGLKAALPYEALNHNFSQTAVDYPEARVLRDFKATSYLLEADKIIDFAKLKTHGMLVMSAAVKNMFGAIPGTTKPEYHSRFPETDSFCDMLLDIYDYFSPIFCITDAVLAMEGNGPTAGAPRHVGALIASKNGHYSDLVGSKIMGLSDTEKLPLLKRAIHEGKPSDLSTLSIYGEVEPFIIPDYKKIDNQAEKLSGILPPVLGKLCESVFRTKPVVDKSKCVGCKKCEQTCPKHAIGIKNNVPVFSYSDCIRCFCCQEFCPKGAITVHRGRIARIINGK